MKQVGIGDFYPNRLLSAIARKAIFQDDGLRSCRDQDPTHRKVHIARAVIGFDTPSGERAVLPHVGSLGIRISKGNSTRVPLG